MSEFPRPELVVPDVERDAPLSLEWINGEEGRDTLLRMGNTPDSISTTTLEAEQQRVRDFLETDTQRTWMIKVGEKVVGATWVVLEPTEYLPAPAVHIMIGDSSVRGQGVGSATIDSVITLLREEGKYDVLHSRHLADNEAATHLLAGLDFEDEGDVYQDADGLAWQNVRLGMK